MNEIRHQNVEAETQAERRELVLPENLLVVDGMAMIPHGEWQDGGETDGHKLEYKDILQIPMHVLEEAAKRVQEYFENIAKMEKDVAEVERYRGGLRDLIGKIPGLPRLATTLSILASAGLVTGVAAKAAAFDMDSVFEGPMFTSPATKKDSWGFEIQNIDEKVVVIFRKPGLNAENQPFYYLDGKTILEAFQNPEMKQIKGFEKFGYARHGVVNEGIFYFTWEIGNGYKGRKASIGYKNENGLEYTSTIQYDSSPDELFNTSAISRVVIDGSPKILWEHGTKGLIFHDLTTGKNELPPSMPVPDGILDGSPIDMPTYDPSTGVWVGTLKKIISNKTYGILVRIKSKNPAELYGNNVKPNPVQGVLPGVQLNVGPRFHTEPDGTQWMVWARGDEYGKGNLVMQQIKGKVQPPIDAGPTDGGGEPDAGGGEPDPVDAGGKVEPDPVDAGGKVEPDPVEPDPVDAGPTDSGAKVEPDPVDAGPTDTGGQVEPDPVDAGSDTAISNDIIPDQPEVKAEIDGGTPPDDTNVFPDISEVCGDGNNCQSDATTQPDTKDGSGQPDTTSSPDISQKEKPMILAVGNCKIEFEPISVGSGNNKIDGEKATVIGDGTQTCRAAMYIYGNKIPASLKMTNMEGGKIEVVCEFYPDSQTVCESNLNTEMLLDEEGHLVKMKSLGWVLGSSATKFTLIPRGENAEGEGIFDVMIDATNKAPVTLLNAPSGAQKYIGFEFPKNGALYRINVDKGTATPLNNPNLKAIDLETGETICEDGAACNDIDGSDANEPDTIQFEEISEQEVSGNPDTQFDAGALDSGQHDGTLADGGTPPSKKPPVDGGCTTSPNTPDAPSNTGSTALLLLALAALKLRRKKQVQTG